MPRVKVKLSATESKAHHVRVLLLTNLGVATGAVCDRLDEPPPLLVEEHEPGRLYQFPLGEVALIIRR